LRSDKTVICWGSSGVAVNSPPSGAFDMIDLGTAHACGLRPNGDVSCWGWNDFNQASPPAGTFLIVTSGLYQSDHTVECWGMRPGDDYGQTTPPTGQFRSISAGELHTCGIRMDNTVSCWGILVR
jgi:alpha-tubulin suppressor-like RCC1 family protein